MGWVRALALSLVGDPDRADELAHEAWLTATERPPRATQGPALRAWLARVTRTLVRHERRAERRRRWREERAGSAAREGTGGVAPSTAEVVVRGELQRRLVEAVIELPEPGRSAVLLRYLDGLSASEIGARTGVSPATVRQRLSRAREALRTHLDRESGGDRAEWCRTFLAALRAAGPPQLGEATGLATWMGGFAVLWKTGVAAIALLSLWLLFLYGGGRNVDRSTGAGLVAVEESAELAPIEVREPGRSDGNARQPKLVELEAHVPPGDPRSGAESSDHPVSEIRGRVERVDGRSPADTTLRLRAHIVPQMIADHGARVSFEERTATTGPDGRFSLRFPQPPVGTLALLVSSPGCASEHFLPLEVLPGQVRDLGTVLLAPGGLVRGRVLDEEGRPPAGRWRVRAWTEGLRHGERSGQVIDYAGVDPETGEYLLASVPPGPVRLRAEGPGWAGRGVTTVVAAGQELVVDFTQRGDDLQRTVIVAALTPPWGIEPRAADLFLEGPAPATERVGATRTGRGTTGRRWTFADLAAGEYELVLEDERFEPLRVAGIQPGVDLPATIEPRGSSALALRILGDDGGELREPLRITALAHRFRRADGTPLDPQEEPELIPLSHWGDPWPPEGTFEGLFPVGFRLRIEARGHRTLELDVPPLSPGERRPLELHLQRGAVVSGFVVHSDGSPARDVEVIACHPARRGDGNATRLALPGNYVGAAADHFRTIQGSTRSDAEGRFDFSALEEGAYVLVARSSGGARASFPGLTLADGRPVRHVEIVLPAVAHLRGRIEGGGEVPLSLLTVAVGRVSADSAGVPAAGDLVRGKMVKVDGERELEVAVGEDGRFEVAALAIGDYDLYAHLPHGATPLAWENGLQLYLGRVSVTRGRVAPYRFDLGSRAPHSVQVRATVDGEPASMVVLRARLKGMAGDYEDDFEWGHTDHLGRASLELFGGDWIVTAVHPERHWSAVAGRLIRVPGERVSEVALDVRLLRRGVQILDDETGQPLSRIEVGITPVGEGELGKLRRETDAAGRLELELPEGSYAIVEPATARAVIDWYELLLDGSVRVRERPHRVKTPAPRQRRSLSSWPPLGDGVIRLEWNR